MNSTIPVLVSPNIGIQWDTVTHVSAESITTSNCFALLCLSPQLVHCTFHSVVVEMDNHLRLSAHWHLSLHHNRDTSRFLDNIKLPCLETLVLLNVIIDPAIAFLERSACSLQTRSLLDWQFRKTDKLIPLLQFLSPSLTRLAISQQPSPMRGTRNNLSLLTQIYPSQSEVVGNDFFLCLEIFEYREESPSTLKSSMLSKLSNHNYPKPATSISLRSVYINRASILNKHIPRVILPILKQLEGEGILTYTWG